MYFRQFYLGCLAHASYMIGSNGVVAVVDPQRDVDQYIDEAGRQGLSIRHVIETHLHADFVSGHLELAERTGARIYIGTIADAGFPHVGVRDGDEIRMGDVVLRFLETPGHTPESVSVLVFDLSKSADAEAVLTGDTLFIGDVGRPDLVGAKMSAVGLAGKLYDSLHSKLLCLPDHVRVYPAHGAGSLCGRNLSDERSSTIDRERSFNYALRPMSREEFVKMMTADLPEAPPHFCRDVEMNRSGPALLARLPAAPALTPAQLARRMEQGCIVLDTRVPADYGAGHVPGAINISLGGQFASWAGTLITAETPILIVAAGEGSVGEARVRLARVGLENVDGYLDGGITAWSREGMPLNSIDQISVDELKSRLGTPDAPRVLDVRREPEWQAGHISGATHIPLHALSHRLGSCRPEEPLAAICASGYRSSIATGVLERNGFRRIFNVVGGMSAWAAAGFPVSS